jgi:hypothetical protein
MEVIMETSVFSIKVGLLLLFFGLWGCDLPTTEDEGHKYPQLEIKITKLDNKYIKEDKSYHIYVDGTVKNTSEIDAYKVTISVELTYEDGSTETVLGGTPKVLAGKTTTWAAGKNFSDLQAAKAEVLEYDVKDY